MYDEARGIGVELLNVGDLASKRVPYRIPVYQRGYAWEDDQIQDFLNDLAELREKVRESPDSDASHFFGAILSVELRAPGTESGRILEVIDGQQRLATLFLTVASLTQAYRALALEAETQGETDIAVESRSDADEEEREFLYYSDKDEFGRRVRRVRIRLSRIDADFYERLIVGDPQTPMAHSQRLLLHAWGAVRERLVTPVLDDEDLSVAAKLKELRAVRQCLTDRCFAIHTSTTNRTEAYRLFAVLNDRGQSLSEGDLLRTRTMELLEGHTTAQERAERAWARILGNTPVEVLGFLRAYYSSMTGSRPPSKNLYDAFRLEFIKEKVGEVDDDAADVMVSRIDRLADECQVYMRLSNGEWPFDPAGESNWDIARLQRLIKILRQDAAISLLMSVRATRAESFFAAVVRLLERAGFRYNISGGHAGSYGEKLFAQAAVIRNSTTYSVDDLEKALEPLIARAAADSIFRTSMETRLRYDRVPRPMMKHFLTTLEDYQSWWLAGRNGAPTPDETSAWDLGRIEIEHVYPQRPKAGESEESLEPLEHSLGNLTFWAPDDNRAASNDRFDLKKAKYAASKSRLTQVLGTVPRWDADALRSRENEMLDLALRIFNVKGAAGQTTAVPPMAEALGGTASAEAARVWLVLQNEDSIYRDSEGELYDYPYSIPNAQQIAPEDVLVCYRAARFAPDGRRVIGLGRIGAIVADGDRFVATYDRYRAFDPYLTFDEIGGDPRTNVQNGINRPSHEILTALLASAGVTAVSDLPSVEFDPNTLLEPQTPLGDV